MAKKESASSKAAEARRAAAELRAKQRAAARRNNILAILGAGALIALFAVAIMFIVKTGEESGPYTVYNSGVLKAPSMVEDDNSIVIGAGGVIGEAPPEGAIEIVLVEDPLCPWCKIFDDVAGDEVMMLLNQGGASLRYHIVSILDEYSAGTDYSTRMANAWATTAEYDPEHFWAFIEASYVDPPEELAKGLTNDEIADLAREAGVSEEAIDKFADGEFTQWVIVSTDGTTEVFRDEDGRFGTPTVLVGGVRFPYWTTPGNMTAAVNYVREYGSEAFADYLANPPAASPSPSPSASV